MNQQEKLEGLAADFAAGRIEKYEFYAATMGYRIGDIYRATGISPLVIQDRRRYLRRLAKQRTGEPWLMG